MIDGTFRRGAKPHCTPSRHPLVIIRTPAAFGASKSSACREIGRCVSAVIRMRPSRRTRAVGGDGTMLRRWYHGWCAGGHGKNRQREGERRYHLRWSSHQEERELPGCSRPHSRSMAALVRLLLAAPALPGGDEHCSDIIVLGVGFMIQFIVFWVGAAGSTSWAQRAAAAGPACLVLARQAAAFLLHAR